MAESRPDPALPGETHRDGRAGTSSAETSCSTQAARRASCPPLPPSPESSPQRPGAIHHGRVLVDEAQIGQCQRERHATHRWALPRLLLEPLNRLLRVASQQLGICVRTRSRRRPSRGRRVPARRSAKHTPRVRLVSFCRLQHRRAIVGWQWLENHPMLATRTHARRTCAAEPQGHELARSRGVRGFRWARDRAHHR